jgi:hypothetical protein
VQYKLAKPKVESERSKVVMKDFSALVGDEEPEPLLFAGKKNANSRTCMASAAPKSIRGGPGLSLDSLK